MLSQRGMIGSMATYGGNGMPQVSVTARIAAQTYIVTVFQGCKNVFVFHKRTFVTMLHVLSALYQYECINLVRIIVSALGNVYPCFMNVLLTNILSQLTDRLAMTLVINCYELFLRTTQKLVGELCFMGGDCRSGISTMIVFVQLQTFQLAYYHYYPCLRIAQII